MKKVLRFFQPIIVLCLSFGLLKTPVYAAGGSGTETDPYIIETAQEFYSLLQGKTVSEHFKLGADINLGSISDSQTSINTITSTGSLDGDGHTISGIKMTIVVPNIRDDFKAIFFIVLLGVSVLLGLYSASKLKNKK